MCWWLGRDKRYLERTLTHARCVLRDGVGIGLLPTFFKPVLGPLITWQGQKACEDSISMLMPLVEKRLSEFREGYQAAEHPVSLNFTCFTSRSNNFADFCGFQQLVTSCIRSRTSSSRQISFNGSSRNRPKAQILSK
jgi:hypothetical protein